MVSRRVSAFLDSLVDEIVSLSGDLTLRRDLREIDRAYQVFLQTLTSGELPMATKILKIHQERIFQRTHFVRRLSKLIEKWSEGNSIQRAIEFQIVSLEAQKEVAESFRDLPELKVAFPALTPERQREVVGLVGALHDSVHSAETILLRNIRRRARRLQFAYYGRKWVQELARHSFEVFVSLLLLTLIVGVLLEPVRSLVITLLVAPVFLWAVQRYLVQPWLDRRLRSWLVENLMRSALHLFRLAASLRAEEAILSPSRRRIEAATVGLDVPAEPLSSPTSECRHEERERAG